ncbi:MAG TPA: hypothetical protein VLB10_06885 [Gammaproteobacteria bacterium]|nr:hypothetical protein [Gammaproteobacteria bacterium]
MIISGLLQPMPLAARYLTRRLAGLHKEMPVKYRQSFVSTIHDGTHDYS